MQKVKNSAEICAPSPTDYRRLNQLAYDALAEEYRGRREADHEKDLQLIQPFVRLLRQQFGREPIRVLDIGCGNGLNLAMFADEGFEVTGIDISPRMLEVARESCPTAQLICDDILTHSFPDGQFHGIFAKAVIHLFPMQDALVFLAKTHRILKPDGIFYVTTTVDENHEEGLREKLDYQLRISRYRRSWTENELSYAVINSRFRILERTYNYELNRGKKWFNIWAKKHVP